MIVVKKLMLALMVGLFPVLASAHAADADVADRAESFIAGYIKADEKKHGDQWIKNSPALTKEFKRAYVKYLAQFAEEEGSLNSDPILNAQDTPESPIKATTIKVTDDHANVELTVEGWPGWSIRMQLVRFGGKWFINAINKINWQQ